MSKSSGHFGHFGQGSLNKPFLINQSINQSDFRDTSPPTTRAHNDLNDQKSATADRVTEMARDTWIITLRPLPAKPNEPPAGRRVAQLLKLALRGFRLQCVSIGPAVHQSANLGKNDEHQD